MFNLNFVIMRKLIYVLTGKSMWNRIVKCASWFLSAICVFYTVSSLMYEEEWSRIAPNLLDAFYKAIGLSVGLIIYFVWLKKRKADRSR